MPGMARTLAPSSANPQLSLPTSSGWQLPRYPGVVGVLGIRDTRCGTNRHSIVPREHARIFETR
eukprot:3043683-Alexandrium_andersonii.AAC.1